MERLAYAITHLEKSEKDKKKRKKVVTHDELMEERVRYINYILNELALTNQGKLAMYASIVRKDHSEIRDLLEMAGRYGLDARFAIKILEETKWNERNFYSYLAMGLSQSEIRMKLEAAREFIAGEWYVTAKYKGQKCHFQMVPMEELEEFRKLLKGGRFENARQVLDRVIDTKRQAVFEENDSAKTIVVTDRIDE